MENTTTKKNSVLLLTKYLRHNYDIIQEVGSPCISCSVVGGTDRRLQEGKKYILREHQHRITLFDF